MKILPLDVLRPDGALTNDSLRHALEALLAAEGLLDHVEIHAGGWSLHYERPGTPAPAVEPAPPVRTVEADILAVLRAGVVRQTVSEILSALGPSTPWGETTVRHVLAAMVAAGTLDNKQDVRPRGYAEVGTAAALTPGSVEADILAVLRAAPGPLKASAIARRAGHKANSYFRGLLTHLKQAGLIHLTLEGYTV